MPTRKLSPYEKTHLARFGSGILDLSTLGEMPVEYATGKCEFAGQVFTVNQDVLITRVESEALVDLALENLPLTIYHLPRRQAGPPLAIAEVGTGSGAIGLSLAAQLSQKNIKYKLYLSDISEKALLVAQKNAKSQFADLQMHRLTFLYSNLLTNYPKTQKFDLIIANLPYIPSQRVDHLDSSVKDFEPRVALDGGPDGLSLIKELVKQAPAFLKKHGTILLEIDHTHDLPDFAFAKDKFQVEIKKDEFSQNRFVVLKLEINSLSRH